MKARWTTLPALVAALFLAGCASEFEPTPKQKEKMARDAEREAQKQAQAQAKMMKDASQSGQRRR